MSEIQEKRNLHLWAYRSFYTLVPVPRAIASLPSAQASVIF